jgi:RNA polymerase sigma-70 factor (ECF subfamily)
MKYAPMLLRFANKFAPFSIAEDIVHDVFISVWEKKIFLLPDCDIKKILYKAARNACIDHLRRLALEQKFIDQQAIQLRLDELDFYRSAEHLFIQDDLMDYIRKQINKLPERQRQIFCLSFLQGLKSNEIARQLNLSVRTIENQLYRARLILRKKARAYFNYGAKSPGIIREAETTFE